MMHHKEDQCMNSECKETVLQARAVRVPLSQARLSLVFSRAPLRGSKV